MRRKYNDLIKQAQETTKGRPTVKAQKAKKNLVEELTGLLKSIALDICQSTNSPLYEDLLQEGVLAMLEMIPRFDPEKGEFTTWVYSRIHGAMRDYSYKLGVCRLPRLMRQKMKKIRCVSDKLRQELQREPSEFEIAEKANLNPEEVCQVMSINYQVPVELDFGLKDKKVPDEEDVFQVEIHHYLKKLPPESQKILEKRYMEGKRFLEIAEEEGLKYSATKQRHKRALGKLRQMMGVVS